MKTAVPAALPAVWRELRRNYWAAVQHEAQNMIKMHNLLKQTAYQPHMPPSLECDNFKNMFDIWGKYTYSSYR